VRISLLQSFVLVLLIFAFGTFTQPPPVAEATAIIVTASHEAVADDGQCSLTEAIILANKDTDATTEFGHASLGECAAGNGDDVITLNSNITLSSAYGPDASGSGLPNITSTMIIQAGSGNTIARANASPDFRILYFVGTLTLNGLTIQGGHTADDGGGIYGTGTLILNNSTVTGNTADTRGGGITVDEGSLILNNSQIVSNSVHPSGVGGGGGVRTRDTIVSIAHSMINNNTVVGTLGNSRGGGLYINGGSLTITASTISANTITLPDSPGGGLYTVGTTTSIANSTISDNTATDIGGAIRHSGINGEALTISNSTISGNAAPNTGGISVARGPATFYSTIVANNGTDCGFSAGTVTSSGYNLVENPGACTFASMGDQIGIDPQLDPLQDNGGPTPTHQLSTTSPALDAGSCTIMALSTDQRGADFPRPNDLPAIANASDGCDVGAYELQATPLVTHATCNQGSLEVTTSAGDGLFDITASAGINVPVLGVGTGTITINGPEKWDNLTITETSGDNQSMNLGQFKCRTDERPVPLLPAHRSRSTNPFPVFSWTAITNANNYRMFVYDDARAVTRTVDIRQNSSGPTSMILSTSLPDGRLFWRVRGRQNRVWGLWSIRFTLFKDPMVTFTEELAPVATNELPPPTPIPSSDRRTRNAPDENQVPSLPAPPNSR
jgi:hypothetical protein